jgi:ComF family protein
MVCTNILPLYEKTRWVCEGCSELLTPIEPPLCSSCGAPVEEEEAQCAPCRKRKRNFSNTAVFVYDDVVRDVIHRFKYKNCPRYAQGLAKIALNSLGAGYFEGVEALVPVPMYIKKRRRRGYNQAEELASAFSALTNVPTLYGYLKRIRDTKPQAGLTPTERANNLRGAFALRKKIELKSFLLIDDIYTTGETLDVCVDLLKQGGAEQVRCLTLAVAVKREKQQKPEDIEVFV